MSYVQESNVPTTHVEGSNRWLVGLSRQNALPLLLLFAFFYGMLYAFSLPPWGLIDEAQHLHYIQYIAEEQALPVMGDLYLSDEIVESLFATRRWDTFHWTPPSAPDAQVMGLEGYSYESYHPPLYYLAMTPFYLLLPDAILVKLYGLRVVSVILSLVTVWALYRAAQRLFPNDARLPFFAGLLLVAIPERAIATSRINNDVLLEVMAALFFLVLTQAALGGLNRQRSFLLGLLLGLAVWVKISAGALVLPLLLLLWMRRREGALLQKMAWMALPAVPLVLVLVGRNFWLYNDPTGFAVFEKLHTMAAVDTSLMALLHVLAQIQNHFWLVWWKGSDVGHNILLTLFYGVMGGLVLLAIIRLLARLVGDVGRAVYQHQANRTTDVLILYAAAVFIYIAAVMNSYYGGMVPVVQGRFMLPAIVPAVILFVYGLWQYQWGEQIVLGAILLLWGMGLASLFLNLLPYFYYWSGVLLGTIAPELGVAELWMAVYQRWLMDKPAFVAPSLILVMIGYGVTLLLALASALRAIRQSTLWLEQGLAQDALSPILHDKH